MVTVATAVSWSLRYEIRSKPNDSGDEAADTPAGPPSPAYVSVHVELPASGELVATAGRNRNIILDTGFEMRNIRYGLTGGAGS